MSVSFGDEGISMSRSDAIFLAEVLARFAENQFGVAQAEWLEGNEVAWSDARGRGNRAEEMMRVIFAYSAMDEEGESGEVDYGESE